MQTAETHRFVGKFLHGVGRRFAKRRHRGMVEVDKRFRDRHLIAVTLVNFGTHPTEYTSEWELCGYHRSSYSREPLFCSPVRRQPVTKRKIRIRSGTGMSVVASTFTPSKRKSR